MKINTKYKRKIRIGYFRLSRLSWISSLVMLTIHAFSSCEDFVVIDPPKDELISKTVYVNDENATAAIRGIYLGLVNSSVFSGGRSGITLIGGLSADELEVFQTTTDDLGFYQNELIAENEKVNDNWTLLYNTIYRVNAVLEGLTSSTGITLEVKELLEGEAKCIRALCYFYLVNLWGDVPLITNIDYEKNRLASRDSISQVYELILSDLKEAQELLPEDYIHAGGERVRVNKSTATALMARTYLYLEDWTHAEEWASEVIESSNYLLMEDLNGVFLKNSMEAIWQLKPLVGHTRDGNIFILTTPPVVALSNQMINTFEMGDMRKTNWIENFTDGTDTWDYPFKYKVKSEPDPDNTMEYSMVLRLAEQYLIRAEARAQQGNISGAQEDINTIRNRAGLENTTASTQAELLDVILHERQVEFFTEWGHRWFDLKRTSRSAVILNPIKPNWQSTDILWPIPQSEMDNNPNLIQNNGY